MSVRAAVLGLVLSTLAACSDGNLGAVSVRWRIVDLQTGQGFDPRAQKDPNDPGACAGPATLFDADLGVAAAAWTVQFVRLTVNDPVSSAPVPIDPKFVVFDCTVREATTAFQIPLGRFAFDLCASSLPDATVCDEGVTPPPEIRTVEQASIINLDVIEIGVPPPTPHMLSPDSGVDAGSFDAQSPP